MSFRPSYQMIWGLRMKAIKQFVMMIKNTHRSIYYCYLEYDEMHFDKNRLFRPLGRVYDSYYTFCPYKVTLLPVFWPGNFQWITGKPMVWFGWNFVGANICTFLDLLQNFDALRFSFFSDTIPCQKKPVGRGSKILGDLTVGADIGTCKISARSDNLVTFWAKQQIRGPNHREALYARGSFYHLFSK